jgi:hypothetical protein
MEKDEGIPIGLAEKTGALMMINRKEKGLLLSVLAMTMRSASGQNWIRRRLGPEYLDIGAQLLKSMGGGHG